MVAAILDLCLVDVLESFFLHSISLVELIVLLSFRFGGFIILFVSSQFACTRIEK